MNDLLLEISDRCVVSVLQVAQIHFMRGDGWNPDAPLTARVRTTHGGVVEAVGEYAEKLWHFKEQYKIKIELPSTTPVGEVEQRPAISL